MRTLVYLYLCTSSAHIYIHNSLSALCVNRDLFKELFILCSVYILFLTYKQKKKTKRWKIFHSLSRNLYTIYMFLIHANQRVCSLWNSKSYAGSTKHCVLSSMKLIGQFTFRNEKVLHYFIGLNFVIKWLFFCFHFLGFVQNS